jgi:hypothetical protein
MTVKELIEKLQGLPPDTQVFRESVRVSYCCSYCETYETEEKTYEVVPMRKYKSGEIKSPYGTNIAGVYACPPEEATQVLIR